MTCKIFAYSDICRSALLVGIVPPITCRQYVHDLCLGTCKLNYVPHVSKRRNLPPSMRSGPCPQQRVCNCILSAESAHLPSHPRCRPELTRSCRPRIRVESFLNRGCVFKLPTDLAAGWSPSYHYLEARPSRYHEAVVTLSGPAICPLTLFNGARTAMDLLPLSRSRT